ncbi:MAG: GTPase domain-containing protein [Deltaproteobacteria bacterium]|nr:GTPase domain-containing protein [Deltaproteobacteria bacterium]
MAFFNLKKREIECKIVYYGPGRSGKTTNVHQIHSAFRQHLVTDLVSIDADGDQTLFLDFLAIDLGRIADCNVRVQLYTVPGQVRYSSTRKLVLREVDGIVFVADSLAARREKNLISLKDLQQNLSEYKKSIFKLPLVLQYNKRDLNGNGIPILPVMALEKDLNSQLRVPYIEASAIRGEGVGETLKACVKLTLASLQHQMNWMKGQTGHGEKRS